ncbi:MAG TPA: signal recognition particle-docking protein FtsY, partial [Actinobacteria bacterium]|nr:signal recognition particle-docking protein FtsY [Actinomycetota bacterium]
MRSSCSYDSWPSKVGACTMNPWVALAVAIVVLVIAIGVGVAIRRGGKRSRPARLEAGTTPKIPTVGRSLGERLAKSRDSFGQALRSVFGQGTLNATFWSDLEDALVAADVGVSGAGEIVGAVRSSDPATVEEARTGLRLELLKAFDTESRRLKLVGDPATVVVVGVNGVGKTTTIAKLAARLMEDGRRPLLGAADTFRAAADTQLQLWAEKVGVDVVSGQAGADPASVAYDALQAGKARGKDVVIVDTAGRLQNKSNLMDELGKIVRVLGRDSQI